MNCPRCKTEIEVISEDEGTCYYRPVNKKLSTHREGFHVPFSCDICGAIDFSYEPVRDVMFLWPYPRPTMSKGGLHLVDDNFRGGSYVDEIAPDKAVVLAIGKGYFNVKKGFFVPTHSINIGDVVHYNKRVPWKIELKNNKGEKYQITLCGFADCYAVSK